MNGKARQAMLRIRNLIDEFSPDELAEAVSLLNLREKDLLTSLGSATPRRAPSRRPKRADFSKQGETRALRGLKLTDEEKYRVLREFESSVREGRLFKTLDDFRSFGTVLGKRFGPVKSIKEALPHLMGMLANMDLESIRSAIGDVSVRHADDEDSFRRLANQIITGHANNSSSPKV
jgi:hypothetical protein